jgi:light-regulated signal transduction histidine kinase (bacteriophytochrome)
MSNSEQNRADGEAGSRREAAFEEFVTTAAHNLREPLRDIASFSQLLAETSAVSADSDAHVYLTRIREGAARMQSLLSDVVDYWTIDAGAAASRRTDMDAALRQALLCAEKQIAARSAVVTPRCRRCAETSKSSPRSCTT